MAVTSKKSSVERLHEPFSAEEVKCRVGRAFGDGKAGVLFLYVDARACQDRLDEVCGETGWETAFRFETMAAGAVVVCELTANIDGKVVRRSDCSELTDLSDAKGAASTAFKRACASLGIGRYLYKVGEIRANLVNKQFYGKVLLPDAFLPYGERQGRDKLEIEYETWNTSRETPRGDVQNYPAELKDAMEYVIETGYCAGRPMKDISLKALGWLKSNSTSKAESDAATKVYAYLSTTKKDVAQDDVDIPF